MVTGLNGYLFTNTGNGENAMKERSAIVFKLGIFALGGLLLSGFLVFHDVEIRYGFMRQPSFCSLNQYIDCDAVARSDYSVMFGFLPVSAIGFAYYGILFSALLIAWRLGVRSKQDLGDALLFMSWLSIPPTIFLAVVSAFVIKALCLLCLLLYAVNAALVLLTYSNSDRNPKLGDSLVRGLVVTLSALLQPFHPRRDLAVFGNSFVLVCLLWAWLGVSMPGFVLWRFSIAEEDWPQVADMIARLDMKRAQKGEESLAEFKDWQNKPKEAVSLYADDSARGPDDAPVSIVVFSDFQCPLCKRAAAFYEELVLQYPKQIRLIYKSFPLDISCNRQMKNPLHHYACQAAELAACAGEQAPGLFWRAHDELFAVSGLNNLDLEQIPDVLGLDLVTYKACLESGRGKKKIERDLELGNRLGVAGTPTVFINSKRLSNPVSDAVRLIVENASLP